MIDKAWESCQFSEKVVYVTRVMRATDAVPVLDDEATLGCLLSLVRQVWPGCHAEPNGAATWDGVDEAERGSWWAVYACAPHRRIAAGATEAEALVAALEAAGGVT
jgi:hypothetical protein